MPDWTLDEFKTLLAAGGKAPAQLVGQIPTITAGTIAVVQQGIHAFHMGRDHSVLSRLMVDYLEEQRGKLVCPVCGRMF
jgi:hypothetical protein